MRIALMWNAQLDWQRRAVTESRKYPPSADKWQGSCQSQVLQRLLVRIEVWSDKNLRDPVLRINWFRRDRIQLKFFSGRQRGQ